MNKYYIQTLKDVRTIREYEIEAETLAEAKDIVWDLAEHDENGNVLTVDCLDFRILESYQINN